MYRFLLLFPAAAVILFSAHLLFHGFGWVTSAMPLLALPLLFLRTRLTVTSLKVMLVLFALEWARAGWVLVAARLDAGTRIHPAAEIMAGVTVFTLLSALVFHHAKLKGI